MQVSVDPNQCVFTLQCTYYAPAVFDVDDNGEMIYNREVPDGAEDAAERAADLCPSRAIRVTRNIR